MIRWGLCCQFVDAPIKFRTATHRYVATLRPKARRAYLAAIARHNAEALGAAVGRCAELEIGAFRVTSQILPLATHPVSGYRLEQLDPEGEIGRLFRRAGRAARREGVRLSFHPDQFVVLNSEREAVVESAIAELELQGQVARLVGADVIVLHAGGLAGGTSPSLERLERGIGRLSSPVRKRLALENDDRCFAPADLAPLCLRTGVPLVYDVHHHRCRPDGFTVAEATRLALSTWGTREPWCHISSPKEGWDGPNPRAHAHYVEPADFPDDWRTLDLTVDVEAKAKERAVVALRDALSQRPD